MRNSNFLSLKDHPWLCKSYKNIDDKSKTLCLDFITKNDHLSKGDFELAINRMFLDKNKPKDWKLICELLSCANSKTDQ